MGKNFNWCALVGDWKDSVILTGPLLVVFLIWVC